MKFEDLNVTSLESWSVRGNIPSWPYDNSYFQVSELYIVFRPGPMVLVPFGNQTWQWEIYDWHWLAVLMGKSVYIYTRVYIYIYIYWLTYWYWYWKEQYIQSISISIYINKTMCILFLIRNRNRWEIRDLSPCLMRHGMCRISYCETKRQGRHQKDCFWHVNNFQYVIGMCTYWIYIYTHIYILVYK